MADLTVGQPAVDVLPLEELAEAARAALPGNPKALLYSQTEGAAELIDVVRAKLRHYEGLDLGRDQIAITSGSSQAIDLVLRTFTELDGPLAMDEVSYGAIPARRLTGRVDHIPFDDHGPQPEAVARHARALDRPFVFYTMPTFQNPTGLTVNVARRREVLDVCRAEGVPILEDDAYYELRYEGERVPSLLELDGGSGLVVRTGTFSKILGAGIRLGWMASSAPLIDRVLRLKPDSGTSPFASAIAARFMQDHMESQIARVRAFYRDKRDLIMEALDRHLEDRAAWQTPEGGFFVWITFDPSRDVAAIVRECAARGVRVRSGADFRVTGIRVTPFGWHSVTLSRRLSSEAWKSWARWWRSNSSPQPSPTRRPLHEWSTPHARASDPPHPSPLPPGARGPDLRSRRHGRNLQESLKRRGSRTDGERESREGMTEPE